MAFIIRNIYVSNYTANNKKLDGTVTFMEDGTQTELKIKLTEEDAVRIFEVFGDRLAATMQTAALAMLADISPLTTPAIEAKPDDDIPF